MRSFSMLLVFCGLAFAAGCGKKDAAPVTGGRQRVVGVTLRTRSHDFYKDLEEGLLDEAAKSHLKLIVQSAETDPTVQAKQIEDFITQRVDAIVVIPCESDTVAGSLRAAAEAKIPVFTADIAANGAQIVSHVASDNHQGGRLAGERMTKLLAGKGKVLIIDHPSVTSVQDRTRGFKQEIARHPAMQIVGEPSAGGERVKAQSVMEDALTRYPDIDGVFGINDDSALGALRAAEAAGKTKIVIIGYDATPEAQAAIKRGSALRADVVQYPKQIGAFTILVGFATGGRNRTLATGCRGAVARSSLARASTRSRCSIMMSCCGSG